MKTTIWSKPNSFSENIQRRECLIAMLGLGLVADSDYRYNFTEEQNKNRFSDIGYTPG